MHRPQMREQELVTSPRFVVIVYRSSYSGVRLSKKVIGHGTCIGQRDQAPDRRAESHVIDTAKVSAKLVGEPGGKCR